MGPESLELADKGVGEEDVTGAAILGEVWSDTDSGPWGTVREECVTDTQPDDFRKPEAGSEGYGDDEVVADGGFRSHKNRRLFRFGQGLWR